MRIDKANAMALVRGEAAKGESGPVDAGWIAKVEELSRLCDEGAPRTHIAFLGTAMLAKAMDKRADLYAIKPAHAGDNPDAFSARTLCHSVLVPLAAELGIHLGATGREPLNNQPYFRMVRLDDDTPKHGRAKVAFALILDWVKELGSMNELEARGALRAFIAVRRKYQPRYTTGEGEIAAPPDRLAELIAMFVRQNSESGRRAQAVATGLLDVFAGPERVESGRINDPSRKSPGDVIVRIAENPEHIEKAFEVKDKPMSFSDVQIFGKKCADMGVREAAVVMVGTGQEKLDDARLLPWAAEFGIGLTLFYGWDAFVDQVLFWSELSKPEAVVAAVKMIEERLIQIEASPDAVTLWQSLMRNPTTTAT